jgi:hypothetical protein
MQNVVKLAIEKEATTHYFKYVSDSRPWLGKNLSTTPSCPELVEKELKGRKG